MTSQSILRNGVKTPARAFMKPASGRSILKRPAPLPLSPGPFPFAASFSVVLSPAKLSPHVRFAASPAMVAMFSALSPNTYDRTSIAVSPGSAEVSPWAGRVVSPSANAFKLSNPPKRTLATASKSHNLAVPIFEDPRSPKPYRSRAGVRFDELTAQAPRGTHAVEDLGKALYTYPRSPYPSAPVEDDSDVNEDVDNRGRWPNRNSKLDKPPPPARARSLEDKRKRRQNFGLHLSSPLKQNFLSPVHESPRVVVTKPAPLDLDPNSESPESTRLSQAFWQSVSLEEEDGLSSSAGLTSALEIPEALKSPAPRMMFGSKDGSLWSPRPAKKENRGLMAELSVLSPAQRIAFSKGMVASPSPNDPFAAFPSFSVAIMNGMDGIIPYPPRAVVGQN